MKRTFHKNALFVEREQSQETEIISALSVALPTIETVLVPIISGKSIVVKAA